MTLEAILNDLGIPFKKEGEHHHCTPGYIQIDCPFCSPHSQRFRLGINKSYHFCTCWTCGYHKLADALIESSNQSWHTVKSYLKTLPESLRKPSEEVRRPTGRLTHPRGLGTLLEPHKAYLRKRGLDPDSLVKIWKIGGLGIQGKPAWSIYIPIHYKGSEVSWTTRSLNDEGKRYQSARPDQESMPLKSMVYGFDFVRTSCIVVEGPMDAMRIGPGAVATLGVNYTKAQLLILSGIPNRYIVFDQESDAQRRARDLCKALQVFPGKTCNIQLDSKDPGEATDKEIKQLRRLLE